MQQVIFQVDAFTAKPFLGNPAAVCVMDTPAEEGWMQRVAREMNLSETAFLHKQSDGYGLRWFTPEVGGGPVRSRYAGQCAHFVGDRGDTPRRIPAIPHQERRAGGQPRGGLDCA